MPADAADSDKRSRTDNRGDHRGGSHGSDGDTSGGSASGGDTPDRKPIGESANSGRKTIRLPKKTASKTIEPRQERRSRTASRQRSGRRGDSGGALRSKADSGSKAGSGRRNQPQPTADKVWRAAASTTKAEARPEAAPAAKPPAPLSASRRRPARASGAADPAPGRKRRGGAQDGSASGQRGRRPPVPANSRDEAGSRTATPRIKSRTEPRAESGIGRKNNPSSRSNRAQARPAAAVAQPDGTRLNRYLAQQGYCSRREADEWIERGWVMVNGTPAQMGQRVTDSDLVHVEQRAQQRQAAKVTVLINKPIGYVSGQAEDGYEPASVLVTAENRWQEQGGNRGGNRGERRQQGRSGGTGFDPRHRRGLAVAGRLDIDSTGLLVLTQDGRMAKRLIGEDSDTEKEYLVRVCYQDVEHDVEAVFPQQQLQRLRHGLSLDGKPLKPAQVQWQNPEQLRFVLREGKKRQIRRMCEAVGLRVVGLKRVRIGKVLLGRLPQGKWRYLLPDEQF